MFETGVDEMFWDDTVRKFCNIKIMPMSFLFFFPFNTVIKLLHLHLLFFTIFWFIVSKAQMLTIFVDIEIFSY